MVRTALVLLGWLGLFLGSCLALAGCSDAPPQQAGKGPRTVTVAYPLEREVTDYTDYTGRTAAVDAVQVQARVTGYLDKIYFKEGAEVDEGAVLYEIDPRPYVAALNQAKAKVVQDEAQLKYDEAEYKRNLNLIGSGAASRSDLDKTAAARDVDLANIEADKAAVVARQLDVEYAKITAPVTGVISRLLVTRGNLIVSNQTTLTTIVSQDPMWVYFDMDEPTALAIRKLIRQGKFPVEAGVAKVPFGVQLANENDFPHRATMDFVNNQLDQATATLLIRAVVPNPKPPAGPRVFAPNMFVRVRVPTSATYQARLVNAEAVGTDQHLKYLFVVGEDNKVVRRAVTLGSLQDGLQVITDGLKSQERVIVKGLQRLQPGMTVNPELVAMPLPAHDSQPAAAPPTAPPAAPPVQKATAPSPKK
jgi:RND family efflux transporter MFP subunit